MVEVRVSRLFARQRHSVRTGGDVVRRGGEHDDPRPSPEEGLQVVHEQEVPEVIRREAQLRVAARGPLRERLFSRRVLRTRLGQNLGGWRQYFRGEAGKSGAS